jgi:lipoprotein-releasing system permease protein
MPYELFLALRYLFARRRRPMARVTTLAAVCGIAFGVAALIVALALSNGFRDEMRDKILRGTAHVTVMRKDGQPITDFLEVVARLRSVEGIREAAATSYDGALLSGPAGSAYAVVRAVDGNSPRATSEIRRTLLTGTVEPLLKDANASRAGEQEEEQEQQQREAQAKPSPDKDDEKSAGPAITSFDEVPSEAALPGVVLGEELAARTGLRAGDTGQLISGEATLTPLGLAPRYRRVRVAGIFRAGLYEYDATWIYVSLATEQAFAGAPQGSAPVISLEVADIYAVEQTAARAREMLGDDYTTIDWQQANRPLFAALALERRMGIFILALIILLAAINITWALILVVVERRAEIAILSAMGARAFSIMSVFMIEGAAVGILGALCGVALGLVACFVGDRYRLVSLPVDVYSLGNVPFHTRGRDVALAALVAFILSLLATIYPARAAARMRPAEALRDT